MSIISVPHWFSRFQKSKSLAQQSQLVLQPPGLPRCTSYTLTQLPLFVRRCPTTMKYLKLLAPLAWADIPWRPAPGPRPGPYPATPLPYIAAFLVRLDQQHRSMGQLRQYLVEHPALSWLLGFPLQQDGQAPHGFDVAATLPSAAHFSYVLRHLSNSPLQFLLGDTVRLLRLTLPADSRFGQAVSLDTKHILAFVKENNPKAYIKEGRSNKNRQPVGDPDCKYGCKRRRNRAPESTTPTKEAQPGSRLGVGKDEYYWGYASGVVATKVPDWGEFVLAEMTDTFNHADVHYFFPLMTMVEERLGFAPPYGTADAAYDAWYVYEYFHNAGGFAAIPYVDRTKGRLYFFTEEGLPLCEAGLAMPVKGKFMKRSSRVPHPCARHACPLLFPEQVAEHCPVNHKNWANGGCTSTLPTSFGTRIRYQLDREGAQYKALYKQRTVVERIFSQAVALGIERPKLRNQISITNLNSLIYILINLRALQRVKHKKANSR